MTRFPLLPAFLAAGTLLLAPCAARAHGIQSSLERFGGLSAQLESSFSTGEPARNAEVRLVPPGGSPIEIGRTDAQGRLEFRLPAQATAEWEVQVDAGPGHRDYLEVPASAAGPAARESSVKGRADTPLATLLGVGALGIAGALGGLIMRRPRA